MVLAVLWLFSSVTVTPDNQQPPPPALIEKVEANLNVTRCFRRPFRLRREYSYVGWTSGFGQKFNQIKSNSGSLRQIAATEKPDYLSAFCGCLL